MIEGLRSQYHFMPDDGLNGGQKAWDVHRLIGLARDLPVDEIEVSSIAGIDTNHWFESGYAEPTVRNIVEHVALIEACDFGHPIILGADGRVMDGMHRVAKALLEGRSTITAVRFAIDPEPDYRNCHPRDLPYPH